MNLNRSSHKLSKNLHIITLNIPYPPDYGGMIDTFYRIKSLNGLGIDIHLHCFEYGRHHSKELESICKTINYYPRRTLVNPFTILPHIVSTRKSERLLANLCKDNYPIIFDGLHTTIYLTHKGLSNRLKLVRSHNIEHDYYRSLAINESNLIKKLYYFLESFKLRRFENVLSSADVILTISESDQNYFGGKYKNAILLPPSHPFNICETKPGSGDYILFHGDLSIKENVIIADSLISGVFSKIDFKCIVAGKNPPDNLKNRASTFPNIKIVSNPIESEMTRLVADAHILVIPALNSTGFKIKLLYSLFAGRHCLVNTKMIKETHTSEICHIADSNTEIIDKINILMKQEFTNDMLAERTKVLDLYYNNRKNASKLFNLLFSQ